MNRQFIEKLRSKQLSVTQMNELAAKAIARCQSNKSENGLRYAQTAGMWAASIPTKGFDSLYACLNYAEASMREEALVKIIASQEKWLEEAALVYLEK